MMISKMFPKIAAKNFKKGRSSGCNILFIRKSLLPHCEVVVHDAYHVWCKLSKSIINNADKDVFYVVFIFYQKTPG